MKIQAKGQEKKDENLDTRTTSLSKLEHSAFREIAERLREELHLSVGGEHVGEETAIQL
ncbi:hypothetical protein ABID39_001039 [Bartonella japonica]|uniref:Uncharacterized protein n=1 Tax=Bartonella japonica TaxID=357761 RepID=A0ABV2FPF7_9HYPH